MVSALIIGLANHREYDAEADNASPMTVAQSFPASTTAYQPPTQATRIAGSRLSLVAAAENGRCGGAMPTRSGEISDSTPATEWTRTSPGPFP